MITHLSMPPEGIECPLCLGEGKLKRTEVLDRLGVKDFARVAQLSASLHRCLATTNLIESPQSGVRMRTRRVCRWRDAAMVQRWAAASFLATEIRKKSK